MICIVIKGPTLHEAKQQISAALAYADIVELRLDFFHDLDFTSLKILRKTFPIPMIFTLRTISQGGHYKKTNDQLFADLLQLASLKPDYLDIEFPSHFIQKITSKYPEVKIILTYHNLNETPEDLDDLYNRMKTTPAYYYKIAVTAKNTLDALRLLCWKKKIKKNVIAISMGNEGQITRILAPFVGSPITYATIDDALSTAPGQILAQTLIEKYHYRQINSSTKIYGLIGDPVHLSISDVTHNAVIRTFNFNAVYIKMRVTESELPEFIQLAKQLSFNGLSVTMPLKEVILPHIDDLDPTCQKIGACNTLKFQESQVFGTNTDGLGALNAIENVLPVKGKKLVIIGAGGSAKAIAYEAHQRGAHVTILNRDLKKAEAIAKQYTCHANGLDQLPHCQYDILINATPAQMPIESTSIRPNTLLMDIKTKPKNTEFLKHASQKGCQTLFGYRMFVEQALGQFQLWFKEYLNTDKARIILLKNSEKEIN